MSTGWGRDLFFADLQGAQAAYHNQDQLSACRCPGDRVVGIDEIIVYDEQGVHRNPLAKLRLIRELSQKHFDAAFAAPFIDPRVTRLFAGIAADRI